MHKFPPGQVHSDDKSRRELARRLVQPEVPMDYRQLVSHFRRMTELFQNEVAEQLRAPMNAHLQDTPHATYPQKKELAKALNSELAFLGLAVRCPKTQQPSYVVANVGADPDIGRFQICVMDGHGGASRTRSSVKLPELDFVPALGIRRRATKWSDALRDSARESPKNR